MGLSFFFMTELLQIRLLQVLSFGKDLGWAIVLLPLLSFVILGLFGRKHIGKASGIIGTVVLLIATAMAVYTAYGYFFEYGKLDGVYQKLVVFQYSWLEFSPGLSIDMGIMLDPISVMMIVVVTFISLMVHIYSLSYMKGEERFPTYYAFLSLFTFSMLGLVLSSNIFQLYFFWELVGVSSFLLIGFYYDRPSAVAASKKAFIVTRFADLGFLLGILILSWHAGTLDFNTLIQRLTSVDASQYQSAIASSFIGISALTWGLVLIFIGGAGKSAMFPLHIWLPDAMEGPTPVSALIHAATMVVAGVFLVARLFPVFSMSPPTLDVVAYVGVFSALFAALIACTQTDIKRVLAYSTMSQIGYMMFALGVSGFDNGGAIGASNIGFTASMFHLFTHAMFKALLFLGAGAVIHFIHSNEMKDMGGLRKYLPVTHITFLIACLAISGIPPFAGFFSKEEILTAAHHHNQLIYWVALITSGITAFYMFRLYFTIFWHQTAHIHNGDHGEGGAAIKIPLIILSVGAALAGFIHFGNFVTADGSPTTASIEIQSAMLPVSLAVTGILLAAWLYKEKNDRAEKFTSYIGGLYQVVYHKFYIDEIYLFITEKIIFNLIGKPAAWLDKNIVDGAVNATGDTTISVAEKIRGMQSGKVQQYTVYFLVAVLSLAIIFIYLWT